MSTEQSNDEEVICEICSCDKEYKIVGNCNGEDCDIENMCSDCAVFDEDSGDWYCLSCNPNKHETWECNHCGRCYDDGYPDDDKMDACATLDCCENMCRRCAYYNGDDWYCEGCRDEMLESGDWTEEQ